MNKLLERLLIGAFLVVAVTVAAQRASAQHLRPPADALAVYQTIEFQPGATIDFADYTQREVGPLRGYVFVKVQGELVAVPFYHPVPDDGTMWRAPTLRAQP